MKRLVDPLFGRRNPRRTGSGPTLHTGSLHVNGPGLAGSTKDFWRLQVDRSNYRWRICALLFFATTINYLDRQVLGLLKPGLAIRFHWSETDYSYMVVVFTACYAFGLI